MPIYEYTCAACGHTFEHLARTLKEKAPGCPACGARKVAKQFSTFAPAMGGAKKSPCASGACPSAGSCGLPGGGCPGGVCGL